MPERITADRVELRKHEIRLAPRMFEVLDRDRVRLAASLGWVSHVLTVSDEEKFILSSHARWDAGEIYDYGLFRRDDGEYLGNAGLHTISLEHARAEIGYWIAGAFEGRGYVTEAVRALEKAAFSAGFHRLEIRCSSLNRRSTRVPERLGFRLDGRLRDDCVEGDARADTLIFGRLRSDPDSA